MNDTSELYEHVNPAIYDVTTLEAEILFDDSEEMPLGKAVLEQHGFTFPIEDYYHGPDLDEFDEPEPDDVEAVTIMARHPADMSISEFDTLVWTLTAPFSVFIVAWGLICLDQAAAVRERIGDDQFSYTSNGNEFYLEDGGRWWGAFTSTAEAAIFAREFATAGPHARILEVRGRKKTAGARPEWKVYLRDGVPKPRGKIVQEWKLLQ